MRQILATFLLLALYAHVGFAVAQGGPPPGGPGNPLAALPPPPVPVGNPLSDAKVALGAALFWDEQLSLTGTVACGTCHGPQAGGSDPRLLASTAGSVHPGPDGVFGNGDDVIGSAGVPLHNADGLYLASTLFGMAPQVGGRQASSTINAAYSDRLFWDGRAETLFRDPVSQQTLIAIGGALENQALGPLVNSAEMAHAGGALVDMQSRIGGIRPLRLAAAVPSGLSAWIDARSYPELFAEAFGDPSVSAARIAMVIASYERSLIANQTPLDSELSGSPALTPAEQQGRQAFLQAGCQRCHGGALLSDNAFHYIGVRPQAADPGRFAVTGQNADRGRMRTPSLRNVELSAPYMADGRFATLEQVIDFYNRGGDFNAPNRAVQIAPLNLTPAQRAAIAVFLRRPLTDPRLLAESGPFERPLLYSETNAVPTLVGNGMPGTDGLVPRLLAIEPPLAGTSTFTVAIERGLALAQVRLLFDLEEPASPAAPSLWQQSLVLTAQGNGSWNLTLPNDSELAGQWLFVRAFVEDSGAVSGWSATSSARFRLLGVTSTFFSSGFE